MPNRHVSHSTWRKALYFWDTNGTTQAPLYCPISVPAIIGAARQKAQKWGRVGPGHGILLTEGNGTWLGSLLKFGAGIKLAPAERATSCCAFKPTHRPAVLMHLEKRSKIVNCFLKVKTGSRLHGIARHPWKYVVKPYEIIKKGGYAAAHCTDPAHWPKRSEAYCK